jgi:hypothetical protein
VQVQRNYTQHSDVRDDPSGYCLMSLIRKSEKKGSILCNVRGVTGRKRTLRSDETVEHVDEAVQIPHTKFVTLEGVSQKLKC